jgi:hypothetical protein
MWLPRSIALACALAPIMIGSPAHADEPLSSAAQPVQPAQPAATPIVAGQVDLDKDTQSAALADQPVAPAEAPPPEPYKQSLVIDSSIGALLFLGKFGRTAPAGPWLHMQLGYELFKWLMVFGEGELAFTDTSGTQEAPKTRAFPIYGFGGGARFSLRFTDRVGAYLQGDLGAMQADIRKNALEVIGFGKAESLGLYLGGRLGVEWYQIDRHFALGANVGLRDATNFKRSIGSDTPLAFDAGGSIRYAF